MEASSCERRGDAEASITGGRLSISYGRGWVSQQTVNLHVFVVIASVRRSDEALKQGVRLVGFALELGMKLAREIKRMVGDLDNFHEAAVR